MRAIRLLAGGLGATIVFAAIAAGGASAALPELGRCEKVAGVQEGKKTVYHGAYAGKNCTSYSKSGHGKYEWAPGPGPKNKFSAVATTPEPLLETVGGAKVECSVAGFKGEYTGAKTEKISTIVMSGCETAKKPCQTNPAKESEIEGKELEGELGVIKGPPKEIAGWDLKKSGPIFVFTCGKPPEVGSVQTVEGSVIGAVAGGYFGDLNRMSIYSKTRFKQVGGKQMPESFEGSPNDTLTTKVVAGLSTTTEQTGFAGAEEATSGVGEPIEKEENQEALEIRTKPEAAPGA